MKLMCALLSLRARIFPHLAMLAVISGSAIAQHRPPAVPLVTSDPYFSLWSMANQLTDAPTKHWSEAAQPMTGLVRIDGKPFRWMGTVRGDVPAMEQVKLTVAPLHSVYTFRAAGIELEVNFFTPLFPKDMDVLSRRVSYLSWKAVSTDSKPHQVSLMLDVDPQIAVNDGSQPVTWGRTRAGNLTLLNLGSRDQAILHRSGDRIRIDWGYFHLGVPDGSSATMAIAKKDISDWTATGTLPISDDLEMPETAHSGAHVAVVLPLGEVGPNPIERHVLLAYSEGYSIEYLGRKLHPYWQRNGMSESSMLIAAEKEYPALEARGKEFDADLMRDMERVGGTDYAYMTSLAFRQTIAAHSLVADIDGQPMLFSKENDSNGCIDTVDVTYPSSPFFLLFNPELLQAQLEPMMRYAALPRWRFPFAPHDLGTFPLANGQVYGGGELTEENQMPVEESGDLLIMIAAMERAEGNWKFAHTYMSQLKKWASYLEEKGLDPENQLSTDDFAGHLAHNTNLSIKAIIALDAFSEIASGDGDVTLSTHYHAAAKAMAAKWLVMAKEGDHYKLAFDQPNTWSQKYNLVWDKLLDLNLFPASVAKTEWIFYEGKMQPYGLPLDNRKTITKLDWEFWTASLSDNPRQFADLAHRTVVWADSTTSRVPLTDFYDTVSGSQIGFQARSVVGGIFIKALMDPAIAKKYRERPN
ncbi:MAG: DUF4965 domain-containing protein [Granulicella sp.]